LQHGFLRALSVPSLPGRGLFPRGLAALLFRSPALVRIFCFAKPCGLALLPILCFAPPCSFAPLQLDFIAVSPLLVQRCFCPALSSLPFIAHSMKQK